MSRLRPERLERLPWSAIAVIVAVVLGALALGTGADQRARGRAQRDSALRTAAQDEAHDLAGSFQRAANNLRLAAQDSSLAALVDAPGSARAHARAVAEPHMAFLSRLYGGQGEICLIDNRGVELARLVRSTPAAEADLSHDEAANAFFRTTMTLPPDTVHQTRPYVSPDTKEWVIANAVRLPGGRAILHFEVPIEQLRRQAASVGHGFGLDVVDARGGRVVLASEQPQRVGRPLGTREARFRDLGGSAGAGGVGDFGGERGAWVRVPASPENANQWIAVAVAPETAWALPEVGLLPLLEGGAALVLLVLGLGYGQRARRRLRHAADTDALTGLGNRRALRDELARRLADGDPFFVALYDLNGFKGYNDRFGHLAGDALLARLGDKLSQAVSGLARAFRLGGDEFCLVGPVDGDLLEMPPLGAAALTESGEGFSVDAACGVVLVPDEAGDAESALREADMRMYRDKHQRLGSAGHQSTEVLVHALEARSPQLGRHNDGVADLAGAVALAMGLPPEDIGDVRRAAELHDVGKVGIPDSILHKPGPLDADEWEFMRRHTIIGARICAAAPSLSYVAELVRASHERWDGAGYPAGLAGEEIPLGARIIAVCDAFDAMTADRPYSPARPVEEAVREVERCAGSQFDPAVVAALLAVHAGVAGASATVRAAA
jgi:diguanylate cyclase (GGDEF)-like protein